MSAAPRLLLSLASLSVSACPSDEDAGDSGTTTEATTGADESTDGGSADDGGPPAQCAELPTAVGTCSNDAAGICNEYYGPLHTTDSVMQACQADPGFSEGSCDRTGDLLGCCYDDETRISGCSYGDPEDAATFESLCAFDVWCPA